MKMILEVHDVEVGNSLLAKIKNLDYDYQAEQWVQDFMNDREMRRTLPHELDQFILFDENGVRATWRVHNNSSVELTEKSERFKGKWVLNSIFPSTNK